MSFEVNLSPEIERELESYALAQHIDVPKAAEELLRNAIINQRAKTQAVAPLTDEELKQLAGFGKTFGLLADEPDEVLDRIAATLARSKRERFPEIA